MNQSISVHNLERLQQVSFFFFFFCAKGALASELFADKQTSGRCLLLLFASPQPAEQFFYQHRPPFLFLSSPSTAWRKCPTRRNATRRDATTRQPIDTWQEFQRCFNISFCFVFFPHFPPNVEGKRWWMDRLPQTQLWITTAWQIQRPLPPTTLKSSWTLNLTLKKRGGSNSWIDSNLGQRSCHFLLPLHLPPPMVHLGRQFAARRRSDGTTKKAEDKRLLWTELMEVRSDGPADEHQ